MENLIKFYMVGKKHKIEDLSQYLIKFIDELKLELPLNIINCKQDFSSVENNNMLFFDEEECLFYFGIDQDNIVYLVNINIETHEKTEILCVDISSSNYILNIDKPRSYLETLKEKLSKILLKSWEDCFWLFDKESEKFATILYTEIHKVENFLRQFINEILIINYGVTWWNKIVPNKIKNKLKKNRIPANENVQNDDKISIYKSDVQSYKHVNEKLMLIDIADLLSIIKLKIKRVSTIYSEKICSIINGIINGTSDEDGVDDELKNLKSELCKSAETNQDLWNDIFLKYLPSDFESNLRKFERYRNHVAHNKLIDRQAYDMVSKNCKEMYNILEEALKNFHKQNLSNETIQLNNSQVEDNFDEIIESDTGISKLDKDDIYEMFEEKLKFFYDNLEQQFDFRADIDISHFVGLVYEENMQELFCIEYKISNEKIYISSRFTIDDSWGGSSTMNLYLNHGDYKKTYDITYTNGDYEYNSDQANYMPITDSEFEELAFEECVTDINNYIDTQFVDKRKNVDSLLYSIIKDGGDNPLAEIPCSECGEEYICINERYGELYVCLNCGEKNNLLQCLRCECYFEGSVEFCANCEEYIKNE